MGLAVTMYLMKCCQVASNVEVRNQLLACTDSEMQLLEEAIKYRSFYVALPEFTPLEVMTPEQVAVCAAGRNAVCHSLAHGAGFNFDKEFLLLCDRFAELRNY